MALWIGNGAVLKSSSQSQLKKKKKKKMKINSSWTKLFIFQNSFNSH